MVIRVHEVAGAADTAAQGEALYYVVRQALDNQRSVEISFEGVKTATSSFVNMAFVELLKTVSFPEIRERIRVTNSSRQINEMIKSRLERSVLTSV